VAALRRAPARWHQDAGGAHSLLFAPLLLLALLAPLSVAAQQQGAGFVSPPLYGSQPAPSFADQLAPPFYNDLFVTECTNFHALTLTPGSAGPLHPPPGSQRPRPTFP
jgi:hypothetical protein